jgi:hypothetical protein
MTMHRYLRLIAGSFVLVSLALGYYVDQRWFLLTAFVGLNLFQSAFTDWCPMITFLNKLGIPECRHACRPEPPSAARHSA